MSSNKTATENDLGELHGMAARVYKRMLMPRQRVMGEDADGNPITEEVLPTAAEMAQINAFLKQNNITCAPSEDNAVGELAALMKERRARRAPVLPDHFEDLPTGMH